MNGEVLGNLGLDRFDVLIVGSGASGGAAAELLCRRGQRVLILEAGPNYFDGIDRPTPTQALPRFGNDELKQRQRHQITPDPLVDPQTFRRRPEDGDRLGVGSYAQFPKTLGGGATHADLKTPRFLPDDLRLASLRGDVPGASFVDWPVSYDELEPFYLYTERLMGVQGLAGADPQEPRRSAPYPMPPGITPYLAELVKRGTDKLGYQLFPCPTAVNSRPYDGRPACVDCGFCQSQPCPINAKGSPGVTTLRKALLSGHCQIRTETRAVRLLFSGDGATVTGVEALLPDGKRATFRADRYLLAANPVEDVRLLLLSAQGAALKDQSGLIGRHLMLHRSLDVLAIFEDQLHGHRGHGSTHGFSNFRVPRNLQRPLGGLVLATPIPYLIEQAYTYLSQFRQLGVRGALFKKLLRQGRVRDRILSLSMYGEDAPQASNVVDLDPAVRDSDGLPAPRLTYRNHEYEESAVRYYAPKLIELAGAAGARFAALAPTGELAGSGHLMGTLRFGVDPRASVCARDGRFHGIGNLYGSGASLFPTSSGFNPTLTIATVSAYVAASMVSPGSPERALS